MQLFFFFSTSYPLLQTFTKEDDSKIADDSKSGQTNHLNTYFNIDSTFKMFSFQFNALFVSRLNIKQP